LQALELVASADFVSTLLVCATSWRILSSLPNSYRPMLLSIDWLLCLSELFFTDHEVDASRPKTRSIIDAAFGLVDIGRMTVISFRIKTGLLCPAA
jgi:hypothetical protein